MLRARDAIDRAYAHPLDITNLAKVASVSEAHFIRTFKATFGETPHRYLQRQDAAGHTAQRQGSRCPEGAHRQDCRAAARGKGLASFNARLELAAAFCFRQVSAQPLPHRK